MLALEGPSQELRVARRALEGMAEVVLLHDWTWNEAVRKWVLVCDLQPLLNEHAIIPRSTRWYIVVDPTYPWGTIKFYPAKVAGLTKTFPHQTYNAVGDPSLPWRRGDICLDTTVRVLGRHSYDTEPYDSDLRLAWRFRRALAWLRAAARGELLLTGDPFELPHFPLTPDSTLRVAFAEDQTSFGAWESIRDPVGTVELLATPFAYSLVRRFCSLNGTELIPVNWGQAIAACEDRISGVWIRLNEPPIIPPWQAPITFRELRQACTAQGISIDDQLRELARYSRDGKERVCLLGFPIPVRIGEAHAQFHWQAMLLPPLPKRLQAPRGFRKNDAGYWHRDRTSALRNDVPLRWVPSENWSGKELSARGRLPTSLSSTSVLMLGGGALGSVVAELLVRAGVSDLTIADGDHLFAGNLVRHTLGLPQLTLPKAAMLAHHLNLATPHAAVGSVDANFPFASEAMEHLDRCTLVVDSTASDELLAHMADRPWSEPKQFVSLSLGFQSRRLFCFTAYADRFPLAIFRNRIEPWLRKEYDQYERHAFPREGVGCWHPIFPARVDDVWMMAALAIKEIEQVAQGRIQQPQLTVFEQTYDGDLFMGVRRLVVPPDE